MKYECSDIFMIRTPSLPIEKFLCLQNSDNDMKKFITDNKLYDFINESLLFSSRSLQKSLDKDIKKKKKLNNYNLSLIKYVTRASTRPTPYGLLASVGLGRFMDAKDTQIIIDNDKFIRDANIDNYWICCIIQELEKQDEILTKLNFKFNTLCYKYGDRMKNPYDSNYGVISGNEEFVQENNIKHSALVDLVKKYSENFINFEKLKLIISQKYEGVPDSLVTNTLKKLVENEYLLSDLRIPAYCDDCLEHVIQKLEEIKYNGEKMYKLKILKQQIDKYIKSDNFKEGAVVIQDIFKVTESISKSKDYLKVNRGLVFKENNLPYELKVKMESFVDVLSDISVNQKVFSKLDKFIDKFSENYGFGVEVPLIEIIDANGFDGLSLIQSTDKKTFEKETMVKGIIDRKILYALMKNEEEINLKKSDFEEVIKKYPINNHAKSFDINFFITKADGDYNITVGPNIGASKGGNMFQRFANCFDKEDFKEYNKIYEKEKMTSDDEYVLVEARELNVRGRANNITNKFMNYDYYIPIALTDEDSSKQITIEDLVVGLSRNRKVYLKINGKDKMCKIVTDNMLNTRANSKLLRLLKEISSSYESNIINRLVSLYDNKYTYVPRIKLEGITIHLRRWMLSEHMVDLENFEKFKNSLEGFCSEYSVDKLVYMCEYDNRLILDLDKDESIKILYSTIKKQRDIKLCELEIGLLDNGIVKDKMGKNYVSEMIFSFTLNNNGKIATNDSKQGQVKQSLLLQSNNRIFEPFKDGWVYVKLYGIGSRENEILSKIEGILKSTQCSKFFYLRYHDECGKHLRIRFKFSSEKKAIEKIIVINEWLRELRQKALINKWVYDTYHRELNRYGGLEVIEETENLFFADSIFAIKVLELVDIKNESDREKAYVIGLSMMLKGLTETDMDMFAILDTNKFSNSYRQEFNKNKSKYVNMVEKVLLNNGDYKDSMFENMKNSVLFREKVARLLKAKLSKYSDKNNATKYKASIILSLMHMYCNRLTGIRAYEEKYLSMIRHSLHMIIERNKHLNKSFTVS
ncbi:lantibiotic dehydratase [Clostridiaceae bacterium M8S5]|nr:lantibiotic dehydratase [Clostridiaceae bacterium M8S5]